MAKMKIEVQAQRVAKRGLSLRDRLVAHLPDLAPFASLALPRAVLNLRDTIPGLPWLSERLTGFARTRPLPVWRRPWRAPVDRPRRPDAVFFADTFNRYFEPENCRAAVAVLHGAGLCVADAAVSEPRPLCCGRTYLSVGLVDRAKAEMTRTINALRPHLDADRPVIGLEPSCLLTFRDEAPRLLPDWDPAWTDRFQLLEEALAERDRPLGPRPRTAWLHGHCHQKAENAMDPVERTLRKIPELTVKTIDSSCCGMAGVFGYQAETADVSRAMGELALLPAVRGAEVNDLIIADGTSCRHQIADGTGRRAMHVARVLEMSMNAR